MRDNRVKSARNLEATSGAFRPPPLVWSAGGEVLQLSMRRLANLVAFAQQCELEDVVTEVTGADRVEPDTPRLLDLGRRAYKAIRWSTGSPALAQRLAPAFATRPLTRDYALFFPVFNNPYELYALRLLPRWRERCAQAACFIAEIWLPELPEFLLELLSQFDRIYLAVQHPVGEVARITGRPCSYLPLAADVLTFAPRPPWPARTIDLCNIGRRSAVTHRVMVRAARRGDRFYFYDTVCATGDNGKQRTFAVGDAAEHRALYANLLKRSRYFVANKARVNEPEKTRGHEEISGRYYEGAAAGTVMLGVAPDCAAFRAQFDWPGAALPLPFDCPDVAERLAQLDAQPERMEAIRRENVRQACLRHDWVHRLFTVYRDLGLAPTPGMRARAEALAELARA